MVVGYCAAELLHDDSEKAACLGPACNAQVQQAKAAPPPINAEQLQPLSQDFKQWFKQRGISEQTLARNGVRMQQRYCAAERREMPHIAFPYFRNGGCVNVKFRALPKHFSQTKGGEQIFYGYDDAKVRMPGSHLVHMPHVGWA